MSSRAKRLLLGFLSLLVILLFRVTASSAQSDYTAQLYPPDMDDFPYLTAYLDVHDPGGEFVHGLTVKDIAIQENDVQLPANSLLEKKPGVQFVVAITPGSSFDIRDGTGTSRYGYLLNSLLAGTWAAQPPGVDDFSLLTMGGPQLTHSSDPADLRSALEAYIPDGSNANPNLEALAAALQVASDPTPRPGMERAILYITPPQSAEISLGLQSIIASAGQQNIHIFVWLVAAPESFSAPEIDLLRNLADQTHASFLAFSHDEPLPDLESILEPLRYVYQVGYDSRISASGSQNIAALVTVGGSQITSPSQAFELEILPPNVEIIDPPSIIRRQFDIPPTSSTSGQVAGLLPQEQVINIQVTYPDGHIRPLNRTSLYVDGAVAAENTTAPFGQFIWDLSPYTQDVTSTLYVEASDTLGMVGKSADISVRLTVPSTTQEVAAVVSQKRLLVIGITIFISATILVLVLVLGGRIHPKPYPGQVRSPVRLPEKPHASGYRERLRQLKDPVTQPVKISSFLPAKTRSIIKSWGKWLPWQKPPEQPASVLAYLMPLVGADEPTLPNSLQITADQVTLGTDVHKAGLIINDPSIEGVHAVLKRQGKSFRITDAGSVAGTWVNYSQVPSSGVLLKHADIIHLGRIVFRFNLPGPPVLHKITITPLERDK